VPTPACLSGRSLAVAGRFRGEFVETDELERRPRSTRQCVIELFTNVVRGEREVMSEACEGDRPVFLVEHRRGDMVAVIHREIRRWEFGEAQPAESQPFGIGVGGGLEMVKEVGEFVRAVLWGPRGSISRCALGRVGEIDGCLGYIWDWFGTARFDRQRTAVVVTVGCVVADGSTEF